MSGGKSVFILLVAVIGLLRQSHDFDENKQLDHESTINLVWVSKTTDSLPCQQRSLTRRQNETRGETSAGF